jgi:hypothetical protein
MKFNSLTPNRNDYEIVDRKQFSHSLDSRRVMNIDQKHLMNRIERQSFLKFCRNNSYSIDVANFPVLVGNIEFPNFKEELDV